MTEQPRPAPARATSRPDSPVLVNIGGGKGKSTAAVEHAFDAGVTAERGLDH